MSIINKTDFNVFAAEARTGEIELFPDILRGWGVTADKTAGKPPMEWFNAVGKRTDEWSLYLTQRGLAEWSSDVDYPKFGAVQYQGKYYVALLDNKGYQPDTSQNRWILLADFIGAPQAVTDALKRQVDKTELKQTVGDSITEVMSQKAVTDELAKKQAAGDYVNSVNGKTGAVTITAADLNVLTRQDLERLFEIYTPSGMPLPWPQSTPPVGWIACIGQAFDKNRYPLLGKAYPSGKLPDLRGEFIRGWDAGRGVDGGREIVTLQHGTVISGFDDNDNGDISFLGTPNVAFGDALTSEQKNKIRNYAWIMFAANRSTKYSWGDCGAYVSARPRNIAFLYIVRAA